MNKFFKELESGEIHQRDRWQFELKSDFFPNNQHHTNTFTQEFYIFIPNALQINSYTYSKEDFYRDLTNLIRYKTPVFSISSIIDPLNPHSPLNKIEQAKNVEFELKLLANIIRSSVREEMRLLFLGKGDEKKLARELLQFRKRFLEIKGNVLAKIKDKGLITTYFYVDEFINDTLIYYLTSSLERLQEHRGVKDPHLQQALIEEELYREHTLDLPLLPPQDDEEKEYVLYKSSLLNKYVLDALLLDTVREPLTERLGHFVGALSAGVAMLVFFVLFVWQGQVFVINSLPFIFATVILYVMKDRIKESLRALSTTWFHRWFYDWKTVIRTSEGTGPIGKLIESFSLIKDSGLREEIRTIRNREFHTVLEQFARPESVIHYKKRLVLYRGQERARRTGLNIIFRFNLAKFLEKADEPIQSYVSFDPKDEVFVTASLPKVYHINIILKNTTVETGGVEWKKFRLVVNKNGIKRVEAIE